MSQLGEATRIAGCRLLRRPAPLDERGSFSKPFHAPTFDQAGAPFFIAECFWSVSKRGVIRGMHFQTPPHDHQKIVTCLTGSVFDVVMDVRRGSPTYGQWQGIPLTGGDGLALLIPSGCAHGFQALADDALMLYLVDSAHAPEHDGGIRWDSCGIAWPLPPVSVSKRDQALPALDAFDTPFAWNPA